MNEQILNSRCTLYLDERDCRRCDNGWSLTARWQFADGSAVELDGRGYNASGGEAEQALRLARQSPRPAARRVLS